MGDEKVHHNLFAAQQEIF